MLIILTGPTASGKDTIMHRLLEHYPQMQKVVTTTSRKMRGNEQNGIDYNFISLDEFKAKIEQEELIEWVSYGGNFYGTEKEVIQAMLNKDAIWRIDPSRAGRVKELVNSPLVIYIKITEEEARERLKKRSLSDEEINKRLEQDAEFWQQYKDQYDYVVENPSGKLDETVREIIEIIETHKRKLSLQ